MHIPQHTITYNIMQGTTHNIQHTSRTQNTRHTLVCWSLITHNTHTITHTHAHTNTHKTHTNTLVCWTLASHLLLGRGEQRSSCRQMGEGTWVVCVCVCVWCVCVYPNSHRTHTTHSHHHTQATIPPHSHHSLTPQSHHTHKHYIHIIHTTFTSPRHAHIHTHAHTHTLHIHRYAPKSRMCRSPKKAWPLKPPMSLVGVSE